MCRIVPDTDGRHSHLPPGGAKCALSGSSCRTTTISPHSEGSQRNAWVRRILVRLALSPPPSGAGGRRSFLLRVPRQAFQLRFSETWPSADTWLWQRPTLNSRGPTSIQITFLSGLWRVSAYMWRPIALASFHVPGARLRSTILRHVCL